MLDAPDCSESGCTSLSALARLSSCGVANLQRHGGFGGPELGIWWGDGTEACAPSNFRRATVRICRRGGGGHEFIGGECLGCALDYRHVADRAGNAPCARRASLFFCLRRNRSLRYLSQRACYKGAKFGRIGIAGADGALASAAVAVQSWQPSHDRQGRQDRSHPH